MVIALSAVFLLVELHLLKFNYAVSFGLLLPLHGWENPAVTHLRTLTASLDSRIRLLAVKNDFYIIVFEWSPGIVVYSCRILIDALISIFPGLYRQKWEILERFKIVRLWRVQLDRVEIHAHLFHLSIYNTFMGDSNFFERLVLAAHISF